MSFMASQIAGLFTAIASFLSVFTAIVLVHELGHFMAARALSIRVYEFSVGFPFSPRLLTVFSSRGTAFTLRLLPIGGFVRFAEDEGSESLFLETPAWKRATVIVAGPLSNLAFALALLTAYYAFARGMAAWDAAFAGIDAVRSAFAATFGLLYGLFSGAASTDGLAGPVGIAMMAGRAANAGPGSLLYFTGLLSLSVGVMNLLPLPALDGGQLTVAAIEFIGGRRLSAGAHRAIGAAGIALLVVITVAVSLRDVLKIMA
jgi:regulator of sigma E protease